MFRNGVIYLLVGLVLLGASFAGALPGLLGTVGLIVGLVTVYLGAYRLLWAWRRRKIDLLVALAATWMIVLILAATFAAFLGLPDPTDGEAALAAGVETYMSPFEFTDHWFGTNGEGLDLLSRAIYGTRVSLVIAFVAVGIGTVVGGAIGVFAGYYRKWADRFIAIGTNSLLAIPPLILLMAIGATIAEQTVLTMALSLSLLTIPTMIRMARANTIAFSQREFVTAARALGASRTRVMVRELVPNVAIPLMSMAMILASGLIVAEASLSYLGLGLDSSKTVSWGSMIAEGSPDIVVDYPFVVLIPGVFLFLTVFSLNLLGERAQKRWDTRSAKL